MNLISNLISKGQMPSAISGPHASFLGLSNHTQVIVTLANQVKSLSYIVQVK